MDKIKTTAMGGLTSGLIGGVCCVGPALFAWLGLGTGTISFARDFGVLHIPMLILAAILLGTSFYLKFVRKNKLKSGVECRVSPSEAKYEN